MKISWEKVGIKKMAAIISEHLQFLERLAVFRPGSHGGKKK